MSEGLLKGRRPFRVTEELREAVKGKVRKVLEPREEVALALIFGSFVRGGFARDVDLAVYLARSVDLYEAAEYSELLGRVLERETGLPFDVVVLNVAGEGLLARAMRGEKVLVRDQLLYHALRMLVAEAARFTGMTVPRAGSKPSHDG
ncbi:nucleotidyltransferase domain-containing protein [Thermofilum pendens]|uniref:DNA polymerase, beta domain protein region n=1 Tax=Thermofilum pendens (strain DSM 2475 / Hrk 5) TaxID=368408 RepID=A1RZM0_THEPD|nr:nucleotidyltransferase domain-containing protein [Thermofilum pendens]ABL78650.1 DNA polymerase, beta domain protein region [Thermofilum pendens Hrk 5]